MPFSSCSFCVELAFRCVGVMRGTRLLQLLSSLSCVFMYLFVKLWVIDEALCFLAGLVNELVGVWASECFGFDEAVTLFSWYCTLWVV